MEHTLGHTLSHVTNISLQTSYFLPYITILFYIFYSYQLAIPFSHIYGHGENNVALATSAFGWVGS